MLRLGILLLGTLPLLQEPAPATHVLVESRFLVTSGDLRGEAKPYSPWSKVPDPAGEAPKTLPDLLRRLQADDIAERDAALGELEKLGAETVPHLKKAFERASLETQSRLTAVALKHWPAPEPVVKWTVIAAGDYEKFLAGLSNYKDLIPVFAPHLVAKAGRKASISVCQETAFVQDYEMQIGPEGSAEDPIIGTASTGMSMGFEPRVLARRVTLHRLVIEVSAAKENPAKPRQIKTPFGTVEDPEIQRLKFRLSPEAGSKEAVLVGPLRRPWSKPEDPRLWVLLKVRTLKEE